MLPGRLQASAVDDVDWWSAFQSALVLSMVQVSAQCSNASLCYTNTKVLYLPS